MSKMRGKAKAKARKKPRKKAATKPTASGRISMPVGGVGHRNERDSMPAASVTPAMRAAGSHIRRKV